MKGFSDAQCLSCSAARPDQLRYNPIMEAITFGSVWYMALLLLSCCC